MTAVREPLLVGLLGRCSFPPAGTAVDCAASGGADSTALVALAVAAQLEVTAIHVDHGLRSESAAEAEVVEASARRLGAAFRSERVVVEPGGNVEARARAARYQVLPTGVLTGHTANDQAETVLLNLLRGAGLEGLAGMRAEVNRPILGLRRSETEALCDELGLEVVHDPSNRDMAFRRNRVRHELIPLMNEIASRDIVPVLVRQAGLVREAADHLAALASELDPGDARALAEAPPPLARIAVRDWLRQRSSERHPPDAATVDRVLSVAAHDAAGTDVGGGWRVTRSRGRLTLVPPDA